MALYIVQQHLQLGTLSGQWMASATVVSEKAVAGLRLYRWWSLCTLYLHACQMRVTVGNSGFCCLLVWCLSSNNYLPSVLMLQVLLSHAGVCGFCLFCF